MRLARLSSAGGLALILCACGGLANEHGNLSAKRTGELVTDLAPRQAPDTDLRERCGDGSPTDAATSLVRPYLQQETPTGTLLVVNSPDGQPVAVDVSTADGEDVQHLETQRDPSVHDRYQQLATITNLMPATSYCYSVTGLNAPAGFRTPPRSGVTAKVSFAAFGDSGSGHPDQLALFEQLMTVPLDLILHTGDLAYDDGSAAQFKDYVFGVYAPLLKSFPLYPVAGNHDYGTDEAGPYLQAFVLPDNGDAGQAERYYSFDWGDVHFAGLDTERIDSGQAAWLDADLTANRLPWTIVYGHRPPYSSGEHGGDGKFRKYFVPIIEKHGVSLVLSGHDHDYERTRVRNGVTYVVTGGGGRGTRDVGRSSFTAFSEEVIHFVFVEIVDRRLVLHAIDGTGREFDQAVIELPSL